MRTTNATWLVHDAVVNLGQWLINGAPALVGHTHLLHIVNHADDGEPVLRPRMLLPVMRWPIGSSSGHNLRATDWLRIATAGACALSRVLK